MTVESIEVAFGEWRKTLTVVDRPSNQEIFGQGYIAGWNAKEAVPTVPQAAWQPIETAPHETKVLLGWWYNGEFEQDAGYASHGWSRNGISTMSRHGQATHWQPLPAPLSRPQRCRYPNCDLINCECGTLSPAERE